jgi:hypothetical protein
MKRTFLTLIIGLAACSGSPTTVPAGARMRVVSGGGQSDTVDAFASQPLVLEIRDAAGAIATSMTVNLTTYPADSGQYAGRLMGLCQDTIDDCTRYGVTKSTDNTGELTFRALFGRIAGPEWIRVAVPELGLIDSVRFVVLPGQAVHFAFGIADSSGYVGASYATRPQLADRWGNTVPAGAFTVQAVGAAATVTSDGTFHAVAIGRGEAIFRSGAIVDTAWMSVPPRGQIAAFDLGLGSPAGIVTFELDGSRLRHVTPIEQTDREQTPDWLPDGEIVFEGNGVNVQRIMVVDSAGTVRRVTPAATPTFVEVTPATGRDGRIYFAGRGPGDPGYRIWVSTGTGQTPSHLFSPPDTTDFTAPAPAPSGSNLAYIIQERGLFVYDQATTATTKLAPATAFEVWPRAPRWSPDASQLVFNDDTTLYLIHPDGSGRRSVGPKHLYYARADWSPDGAWLIARTRNRLELINVATNESLVLPPWTEPYLTPAWRH